MLTVKPKSKRYGNTVLVQIFIIRKKENMELLFNDEIVKETKYKGYLVTQSGKVLTAKVKGGQGKIDYEHMREHCYKEDKDGYKEVLLSNNGDRKYMRTHRLIWETFNGEIPDNLTIDHIDTNKQNNDKIRKITRIINQLAPAENIITIPIKTIVREPNKSKDFLL